MAFHRLCAARLHKVARELLCPCDLGEAQVSFSKRTLFVTIYPYFYCKFEDIIIFKAHIFCWENHVTISTKSRLSRSIGKSKNKTVFLRKDFEALGTPSRVTRALTELIAEGKLIRLGYGVYAKARPSVITGNTVPVLSLEELAYEALKSLGANPRPSAAQRRYNSGETTQIPMSISYSVSKRINRNLSLGNQTVKYEISSS